MVDEKAAKAATYAKSREFIQHQIQAAMTQALMHRENKALTEQLKSSVTENLKNSFGHETDVTFEKLDPIEEAEQRLGGTYQEGVVLVSVRVKQPAVDFIVLDFVVRGDDP